MQFGRRFYEEKEDFPSADTILNNKAIVNALTTVIDSTYSSIVEKRSLLIKLNGTFDVSLSLEKTVPKKIFTSGRVWEPGGLFIVNSDSTISCTDQIKSFWFRGNIKVSSLYTSGAAPTAIFVITRNGVVEPKTESRAVLTSKPVTASIFSYIDDVLPDDKFDLVVKGEEDEYPSGAPLPPSGGIIFGDIRLSESYIWVEGF